MSGETVLLLFALQEEVVDINMPVYNVIVVVTGTGKANAAMMTMKAVLSYRPSLIINVDTAGTFNHHVGDIIVSNHFVDRDLMCLQLPGVVFDKISDAGTIVRRLPSIVDGMEVTDVHFVISTGDDFVTSLEKRRGDVVDMESFAEASVCGEEGVPFFAVKYITDIVGRNSINHWGNKLADARRSLETYFASYMELTSPVNIAKRGFRRI